MPPPTEHSLQSVLQGVPPEERRTALIEALCAELEGAIKMREKAIARYDSLHENRLKEADIMIEEMQVLVRYRDDAIAQLAQAREEHRLELEASRQAVELAVRERDQLAQRATAAEAAHQSLLKAQTKVPSKSRTAEQEALQKERDAYKDAADKLLEERIAVLGERDKTAAVFASENQVLRDQLAELRTQRDHADVDQQKDRSTPAKNKTKAWSQAETYEQEIAFIARERDAAVQGRDQLQADLTLEQQARTDAVTRLREENSKLTSERDALSNDLTRTKESLTRQLEDATAEQAKIRSQKDDLAARLDRTIEENRRSAERLGEEKAAAVQVRRELEAHLEHLRLDHEQRLLLLTQERDGLLKARDAIVELRETHRRDLQEFDAQRAHYQQEIKALQTHRDDAVTERDKLAAALESLQSTSQHASESLVRERDELRLSRQELSAELALLREDQARQLQALAA